MSKYLMFLIPKDGCKLSFSGGFHNTLTLLFASPVHWTYIYALGDLFSSAVLLSCYFAFLRCIFLRFLLHGFFALFLLGKLAFVWSLLVNEVKTIWQFVQLTTYLRQPVTVHCSLVKRKRKKRTLGVYSTYSALCTIPPQSFMFL